MSILASAISKILCHSLASLTLPEVAAARPFFILLTTEAQSERILQPGTMLRMASCRAHASAPGTVLIQDGGVLDDAVSGGKVPHERSLFVRSVVT